MQKIGVPEDLSAQNVGKGTANLVLNNLLFSYFFGVLTLINLP